MSKIFDFGFWIYFGILNILNTLTRSKRKVFGFNAGKLLIILIEILLVIFVPYATGSIVNHTLNGDQSHGSPLGDKIAYWGLGSISICVGTLFIALGIAIIWGLNKFAKMVFKDFSEWANAKLKWLRD